MLVLTSSYEKSKSQCQMQFMQSEKQEINYLNKLGLIILLNSYLIICILAVHSTFIECVRLAFHVYPDYLLSVYS